MLFHVFGGSQISGTDIGTIAVTRSGDGLWGTITAVLQVEPGHAATPPLLSTTFTRIWYSPWGARLLVRMLTVGVGDDASENVRSVGDCGGVALRFGTNSQK